MQIPPPHELTCVHVGATIFNMDNHSNEVPPFHVEKGDNNAKKQLSLKGVKLGKPESKPRRGNQLHIPPS